MKATIQRVAALAILGGLSCTAPLYAQDNLWTGGVGGNWTDSTWNFGAPPITAFDERGIIGTSAGSGSQIGEVNVTSDLRVSNPSPTVVLGDGGGNSGTLNISASGALAVVPSVGVNGVGNFETGLDGGTGVLNVAGTLEVAGELRATTNADAASTVALSGSASLTAASGFLDRNLIIDGSSVSASFTGNLILGQAGTHTWRISNSGASTILVGGNADLGGTLVVEFPGGSPAVGTTWNLVDSALVDDNEASPSGFNNFDASTVGLGLGQKFVVNSFASGTSVNGMFTQLALEQHPVLMVDRSTGVVSIQNPGSTPTVNFDAYAISSVLGSLNPGNWTSIAPASGWVVANPSSTSVSELNPTSFASIGVAGSIAMGSPVQLPTPTAFGQETEDIRFRFGKPGVRAFTEGTVIYTGVPNNTLTLNVDPNTGQAQIINGTAFTATIDVYQVSSGTGSLEPGAGNWDSLADQGTSGGNWFEANVSATRLTELLAVGGLVLAPNAMVPIGAPFDDVGGFQDLVFEFALVGNSLGSAGDFDNDNDRDGADFLQWQRGDSPNLGSAGDLADWEIGYGIPVVNNALQTGKVLYGPLVNLGVVAAAVVPEPSTLGLLAACVSLLIGVARRPMVPLG